MMESELFFGNERGIGRARFIFNKRFPLTKYQNKVPSILSKISDGEFSKAVLLKSLKLNNDFENNELYFWIFVKLFHSQENGGVCVPESELFDFLNLKVKSKSIKKEIEKILSQDDTILEKSFESYYFKRNLSLEIELSNRFQGLFAFASKVLFPTYSDTELTEEQNFAVNRAFQNRFGILSGGPGTGKTRTIQSILLAAIQNGIMPDKIALIAPTGKAAKRLTETAKVLFQKYPTLTKPKTIHRYLDYSPRNGKFRVNESHPVADSLIIVDESSMIDLELMNALLSAISLDKENIILFVGDPDQLLSVSKGSIFSDLCRLNKNHSILTKPMRQDQKEGKIIIELASSIKESRIDRSIFNKFAACKFIDTGLDEDSLTSIHAQLLENPDLQILSPFNTTKIGSDNINAQILLGRNQTENYPAMLIQNLYEFNLFNGEIGQIRFESNKILFSTTEAVYTIPFLFGKYFVPAFAITVHKSQGSEYDHVCLVLPAEMEKPNALLTKRIIYTAITRAKKSVTIIGSYTLFEKIILNEGEPRFSNIEKRIISAKSKREDLLS
jgi:exodeoxyribonuclease V alpha subunit